MLPFHTPGIPGRKEERENDLAVPFRSALCYLLVEELL
jgi:hypothetical protein